MNKLWSRANLQTALAIFALSLGLRMVGLADPAEVIFDEVHFGKFISAYCCTHKHFFDIHPPVAKLSVAAVVALFTDYDGQMPFKSIGEPFKDLSPWAIRLLPALLGSLVPVAVYWLLLILGGTYAGAVLGGILFALDNGFILQSRVLSLEPMLLLSELVAVATMLLALRADSARQRVGWAVAGGIFAAMAVGTKLTGLVAVSLPLLVWWVITMQDLWRGNTRNIWVGVWFVCAVVLIYLGVWQIHFTVLDQPGFGDRYYQMTGDFWKDVFQFHLVMYERNATLKSTHAYSSAWAAWPFMERSIFYWGGKDRVIYFLGNPFVWIGTTFTAVVAIGVALFQRTSYLSVNRGTLRKRPLMWVPIAGYLNAYLPYIPVNRELFLYHYMPPLLFLGMALVLWFDTIGFTQSGSWRAQRKAYFFVIALVGLGFVSIAPLTYGWHAPFYVDLIFKIFPGWR